MKTRHITNLLCITIPICVFLRIMQINFTIDSTTGFIKQQYNDIATLITLVIFAAIIVMCILAYFTENIACKESKIQPLVAISGVLTGGMYAYEMFSCISVLDSIYNILLVFLSLLSAIIFIAYGLKKIYPYNFPSIILVIPTLYYIVKLIKLFVSTSALSLVTENIFLLFANSALLWFMFEFASYENKFGNLNKMPKSMFAGGIAASMLCVVTALPNLLSSSYKDAQTLRADVSSSLLMLSQTIFILSYIISSFCPKESNSKKHYSKHS